MTRQELEKKVRKRLREFGLSWSRAEVHTVLSAFIELIHETLASGESVRLTGFGTLEVSLRAPRKGYHFPSGKIIEIPGRQVIRFRPSRRLKRRLRY
ncbi:HU family DNA-binding protein [Thermosulfurimonas sp. F29]|uniref:HU family DNA-binding protein n=1 Tax=Thermosulfurimonas sp. F29 TaxID=2867247 RepID=UPI001C83271F|nr:HU family DNA-binding protein [Thermosulfurimonas sp. F29]MBX6423746.1 HU family DNA-binding protein [Thermosulfurimonas sp. F29]